MLRYLKLVFSPENLCGVERNIFRDYELKKKQIFFTRIFEPP